MKQHSLLMYCKPHKKVNALKMVIILGLLPPTQTNRTVVEHNSPLWIALFINKSGEAFYNAHKINPNILPHKDTLNGVKVVFVMLDSLYKQRVNTV